MTETFSHDAARLGVLPDHVRRMRAEDYFMTLVRWAREAEKKGELK